MSEKSKLRELTSDEQNHVAGGIGESKPGETTSDSVKALDSFSQGGNLKGWARN